MSNLWFNIRFGTYHWQFGPNGMTLKYNAAHQKEYRKENWRWFRIYEWFGKTIYDPEFGVINE